MLNTVLILCGGSMIGYKYLYRFDTCVTRQTNLFDATPITNLITQTVTHKSNTIINSTVNPYSKHPPCLHFYDSRTSDSWALDDVGQFLSWSLDSTHCMGRCSWGSQIAPVIVPSSLPWWVQALSLGKKTLGQHFQHLPTWHLWKTTNDMYIYVYIYIYIYILMWTCLSLSHSVYIFIHIYVYHLSPLCYTPGLTTNETQKKDGVGHFGSMSVERQRAKLESRSMLRSEKMKMHGFT